MLASFSFVHPHSTPADSPTHPLTYPPTHPPMYICGCCFQVRDSVPFQRRRGVLHQGVGGEGPHGGMLRLIHAKGIQPWGRLPQVYIVQQVFLFYFFVVVLFCLLGTNMLQGVEKVWAIYLSSVVNRLGYCDSTILAAVAGVFAIADDSSPPRPRNSRTRHWL